MKLQADRMEGRNAISRHGGEGVIVNGVEYRRHVLVPWSGEVSPWPVGNPSAPSADDFGAVAALEPELVVFGSGSRLRFPPAAALRPLIERGIGIETMDTAAACRTYNVLLAEGRSVVAALLFDGPAQGA
ncbi:MAG: Mth938-like domain-containing protein [Proteobacteria bacterium]|nr:Mth938-like domain-containing protein [Pseudomonadota bacterium]